MIKFISYLAYAFIANAVLNSLLLPSLPDKQSYNSNETDVKNYDAFLFVSEDTYEVVDHRNTWKEIFKKQLVPRWLSHLTKTLNLAQDKFENQFVTGKAIDILDARKIDSSVESFKETGFTLLQLGKDRFEPTNWTDNEQLDKFFAPIKKQLQALYPEATRIELVGQSVKRGGRRGATPQVNNVHTDFFKDDDRVYKYHVETGMNNHQIKLPYLARFGEFDGPGDEARVILGLWKPVEMTTPVCDFPLAVMNASTMDKEDERAVRLRIALPPFANVSFLMGVPVYRPEQKWYYYSNMKTDELLVMHQWRKEDFEGGYFQNHHCSFVNPNCPGKGDTRVSVEMRAALFFSNGK